MGVDPAPRFKSPTTLPQDDPLGSPTLQAVPSQTMNSLTWTTTQTTRLAQGALGERSAQGAWGQHAGNSRYQRRQPTPNNKLNAQGIRRGQALPRSQCHATQAAQGFQKYGTIPKSP